MWSRVVSGFLMVAAASGCDPFPGMTLGGPWPDEETPPEFRLQVVVQTIGDAVDDGYDLTVWEVVTSDSVLVLSEVRYGSRQSSRAFSWPAPHAGAVLDVLVGVGDIAFNCTVGEQNPSPIQLQARSDWGWLMGQVVRFTVTCVRPPLPSHVPSAASIPPPL